MMFSHVTYLDMWGCTLYYALLNYQPLVYMWRVNLLFDGVIVIQQLMLCMERGCRAHYDNRNGNRYSMLWLSKLVHVNCVP